MRESPTLPIELWQFRPEPGVIAANARRIAGKAAASTARLFITPELSLSGYDPGDDAVHLATPLHLGRPFPGAGPLAEVEPLIVAGVPEAGTPGVTYNSLAVLERGSVRFRHRKVYLPTYGMFDEARFFARGRAVEPFVLDEWRIGFLVCEDFWHPGLAWVLAMSGVDVLIVISAAPGRGGPDGPDAARFASMESWSRLARTTAQLYGIWVVLVNQCGVLGSLTFGGGSMVAAPDGSVVAHATAFAEANLTATLSLEAVHAARRPAAHARDEDPDLMRTLLERLCD